jgi:hypothetical protein
MAWAAMRVGGANRGTMRSRESSSRRPHRWEEAGAVGPLVGAVAAARLGASRGRAAARLGASRAGSRTALEGRRASARLGQAGGTQQGQGTPPISWEDGSGSSPDFVLFGRIRLGRDNGDPGLKVECGLRK